MRGEETCEEWSAVAREESECGIPTDVQNSIAVRPSEGRMVQHEQKDGRTDSFKDKSTDAFKDFISDPR